jgi:transcriptional regulator with PAS, ATPase and Fis domain
VMAHEGTLFLDEIGDMPLQLQTKLLKVIESGEVLPLGDTKKKIVDIRIISALNKNIEACVQKKEFREDLYYRLNVFEIKIPPLRERRDDIPVLANHFLKEIDASVGRKIKGFNQEAMNALTAYDWPGNARELRNVVERAVILSEQDIITAFDLPEKVGVKRESDAGEHADGTLKSMMNEHEREMIQKALEKYSGNKEAAGRALGIDLATLYRKINKYKIDTHHE